MHAYRSLTTLRSTRQRGVNVRVSRGRMPFILASTIFSVAVALAVNVATGGQLPGPFRAYEWLAWPAVGFLAIAGVLLAMWRWHLEHPAVHASVDSAAFEFVRAAELPAAPDLIGRDEDLATARASAEHTRLLVIAAAPGMGKTAFALRLAHALRGRFPDGQLYAALRGASAEPVPAEAVLARFLGAIGRPDDERRGTLEELAARFRSAIVDRRVLVVLDDADDGAQLRHLLPGGDGCLAIVTSRRLPELSGAATVSLSPLSPNAALALLARMSGTRVAQDRASAHRVVSACAGLPLALRIVGARVRIRSQWSLSEVADSLDDEGRRLDELRVGDRAVRSTFRDAYDSLSALERQVFRRVGSDPGPTFGVGAAAARCGLDERTTSQVLNRLVDLSLVDTPATDRFRLHDLLRLFAVEAFNDEESADERVACLARELMWFTRTAQPGDWLTHERDNVPPVLHAALSASAAELAWTLVTTVHPMLTNSNDHEYRITLWQAGEMAAAMLGDLRGQIRAKRWISHGHGVAGRIDEELQPAQDALALAERLGDPGEIALTMQRLGEALRARSSFDEAQSALNASLEMLMELGNVKEEIEVRAALGTLYNVLWQPESSTPMFERAADLLPPRESNIHGWVALGLGLSYKFGGRREEAAHQIAQAFAIAERLNDDYLLGYCHQERGWFDKEDARYVDAERHFRAMLAICERIRHGSGVGAALDGLATIADEEGRTQDALADLDAGIDQFDRLNDRVRAAELRLHRSAVLRTLGRLSESVREREIAEAIIGDATVRRRPAMEAFLSEATE
jgi:tetratricopeptide (TPR) repeat protein